MGVSGMSTQTGNRPRDAAMRHRADLPIPFGWFALANAADLAPGDVRPLFFFDAHLVLFRTEDGEAHVTDAFCPHLGAHLGHGGKVEGNALVCPFHGWRFDGSGACVSVPYARSIPPRATAGACLWSYPVLERNRMIWAWYHPKRVPPLFDLDAVPELDHPDWSEPDYYEWEVETPIQEAGENAVDVAHFVAVHGAAELPEAEITLVGHRRDTQLTCPAPAINADGTIDLTRTAPFDLVTRNCGPGMSSQSFDHGVRAVMLGTVTPITARRMHLRFAFTKPVDLTPQQDMLANGLIAEIVRQVEQDIPIWEHKTYHERPLLCDGDGPIAKYRRWFGQFYDETPGAATARDARAPLRSRIRGWFERSGARLEEPAALLRQWGATLANPGLVPARLLVRADASRQPAAGSRRRK